MYVTSSIIVFAVGAILRFAVTDHIKDVNLSEVGLILMVAGAVGFVVSLIAQAFYRHRHTQRVVEQDGGQLREDIRQT